jgi:hypothetical protein
VYPQAGSCEQVALSFAEAVSGIAVISIPIKASVASILDLMIQNLLSAVKVEQRRSSIEIAAPST